MSEEKFVIKTKIAGIETMIPLEEGREVSFGVSPECDSCIEGDEYLSNKHFKAVLTDGVLHVEDLGSTNGLFQKISGSAVISEGGTVLAGRTLFVFEKKESGDGE